MKKILIASMVVAVLLAASGFTGAAFAQEEKPEASATAQNNPLTIDGDPLRITVMDDSTFGVFRNQGGTYVNQHFGNYAKGSLIWLNGNDPAARWGGGSSSFPLQPPNFVPVSHVLANPWTIVTVYDAGASGVRITETVSYTNGSNYYQVKWDIANNGGSTFSDVRFFHGTDTYFGGFDAAEGYWNDALKMVFLRNAGVTGIMGFYAAGTTPSSHHMENNYGTVLTQCLGGNHLTDTVNPSLTDAGYALEWDRAALAPGATWTVVAYEKWTEAGDVQVYAPSDTSGGQGATVALPFFVQNFGTAADTFDLTATSAEGWPVSAPASIDLDSGETGTVDVLVTVPWGAVPGQAGQVTLEAVSATDPLINNNDSTTVTVSEPPTWYMAEGCTLDGFETWILVENIGDAPGQVSLAFDTGSGQVVDPNLQDLAIPAHTRASYNLGPYIQTYNVATQVTSTVPVVCERAMYGGDRQWATESVGTSTPSEAWYLAEGSTEGGTETWVLVQNPNDTAVSIDFSLNTDSGLVQPPTMQGLIMPAHTRASWDLSEYHVSYTVATEVASEGGPVVCERAMYNGDRTWGTASIGATSPASSWFLAEGCTGEGFATWILVQNPLDTPQDYDVTFLTATAGEVQGPLGQIPPFSRISVNVADYVQAWDVSTLVTSMGGVVAERSMFGEGWATCSVGARGPAAMWYFAEGSTDGGMETWILVENPSPGNAMFTITLDTDTGQVSPDELKDVVIPPLTRLSFRLNDFVNTYNVSARVTADTPVVCERAVYGPDKGWATCSTGYPRF